MYVCLTLYVVYCPDRNCKRGEPREIPASLPIQISLPITTNVMKLDKLVYHLLPSIFIIVQPQPANHLPQRPITSCTLTHTACELPLVLHYP